MALCGLHVCVFMLVWWSAYLGHAVLVTVVHCEYAISCWSMSATHSAHVLCSTCVGMLSGWRSGLSMYSWWHYLPLSAQNTKQDRFEKLFHVLDIYVVVYYHWGHINYRTTTLTALCMSSSPLCWVQRSLLCVQFSTQTHYQIGPTK